MEKIYLVVSSRGSYDDFSENIELAFRNKKEAQMYCIEIDKKHQYEEVYEEVVWNDILNELEKIMEKGMVRVRRTIPSLLMKRYVF